MQAPTPSYTGAETVAQVTISGSDQDSRRLAERTLHTLG